MAPRHPSYRMAPYDPSWLAVFARERDAIATALSLPAERVEHIGSTAVPGLAAKPIVDVMVGVAGEAAYPASVVLLSLLGYESRGETVTGVLYNRKQGPPRVNAHLCVFGDPFWVEHLLFRDYLRANRHAARAYEAEKRRVLGLVGEDPPAYNAAKAPFIRDALKAAAEWQARGRRASEP